MKCPAKPITHAFTHFSDNDEMVKYVRSANMSKKEVRGRKTRILPAMDAEERLHNIPLPSISMNKIEYQGTCQCMDR